MVFIGEVAAGDGDDDAGQNNVTADHNNDDVFNEDYLSKKIFK